MAGCVSGNPGRTILIKAPYWHETAVFNKHVASLNTLYSSQQSDPLLYIKTEMMVGILC